MNLYLVFAIAFGAITGVVEAPVLRPVQFVTQRDRRARRQIRRVRPMVASRRSSAVAAFRTTAHELRPVLRGNTEARAPAAA